MSTSDGIPGKTCASIIANVAEPELESLLTFELGIKMGLFDKIPTPTVEQFVQRREEWEIPFHQTLQVVGLAADERLK